MDRIIYKIINLKDEKDFKEKEDYYNIYINLIKAIDLIISMRKIITTKYLSLDELNIYKYILKLTYYYQKLFNKILTIDEIKEIIEEFKHSKPQQIKMKFDKFEPVIKIDNIKSFYDKYMEIYLFFYRNQLKFNYNDNITTIIFKIKNSIKRETNDIIIQIIKYITNDKLIFNDYYFTDLRNIYKNIKYLLTPGNEKKFGDSCNKYFCCITLDKKPIFGLIVNKTEPISQEHVLIHHSIIQQIKNPFKAISLHLHSYAAYNFKDTKFIYVDPLPIMLNILIKAQDNGILTFEKVTHKIENSCYKFIPSIVIHVTERFKNYYKT